MGLYILLSNDQGVLGSRDGELRHAVIDLCTADSGQDFRSLNINQPRFTDRATLK